MITRTYLKWKNIRIYIHVIFVRACGEGVGLGGGKSVNSNQRGPMETQISEVGLYVRGLREDRGLVLSVFRVQAKMFLVAM